MLVDGDAIETLAFHFHPCGQVVLIGLYGHLRIELLATELGHLTVDAKLVDALSVSHPVENKYLHVSLLVRRCGIGLPRPGRVWRGRPSARGHRPCGVSPPLRCPRGTRTARHCWAASGPLAR